MADGMNEHALKELLGEVLRETSRETAAAVAVCERAFEERLPAMLQMRDPAAEVELTDTAAESIVARLMEAVAERAEASQRDGTIRLWLERLNGRTKPRSLAPRRNWGFALGALALLLAVAIWLGTPRHVPEYAAVPEKGVAPAPRSTEPQIPNLPEQEPRGPVAQAPKPQIPSLPEQEPRGPVARADDEPTTSRPDTPRAEQRRVPVGEFGPIEGEPLVYFSGRAAPQAATPGMVMALGMRIETGDMDKTEIVFSDGTIVAMDFNTTLILPAATGIEPGALRPEEITVTSGRVSVVAVHTEDSTPFAVKTPVATATVVGTRFSLGLRRTGSGLRAVLTVDEGKVAFSNGLGRVVAGASTESTATRQSAPTKPKRLFFFKQQRWIGRHTMSWALDPMQDDEKNLAQCFVFRLGWGGMTATTLPDLGVVVTQLSRLESSPARAAGMRTGDVVLAANGKPLERAEELHQLMFASPDKWIALTVRRNGQVSEIKFKLRGQIRQRPRLARGNSKSACSPPPRLPWPASPRGP